jgi:Xaa-Pro aminopeptidase
MAQLADLDALPPMAVAERLDRLRDLLGDTGADALLVTKLENVRYLTGFTGSAGMLFVGKKTAIFTTDGRYREQATEQMAAVGVTAEIVVDRVAGQIDAIAAATKRLKHLGLEAADCSWAFERRLADVLSPELVPTTGVVEALRIIKDEGELARIERACDVADVALAQVKGRLADGVTEEEFATELDFEMRRRGASAPSFETIVASGPNGALPHARPTSRPIGEGELVVIDFGATVDGYHSDMTRTLSVGTPDSELVALVDAVFASQRAGLRAVEVGASAAAVDAACRDLLVEEGLGDYFVHSTGHGVGLEIHEAPSVGVGSADSLALGTVITVEPGAYLPGRGGVRIEDTVVVTATGARALTKSTKDYTL